MERLTFWLVRLAIQGFRFIPFPVLYGLSNALAFVLQYLIGYRRDVVRQNLRRAFPDKSPTERSRIAREAYRNLADITLETLKSYTLPAAEIQRRCRPVNPEVVNTHLKAGKSVILCGGHYANWEYTGVSMPPLFDGPTVTAYKPISNRYLNAFINRSRERAGMRVVPMEETFAAMRQYKADGIPAVFILLADQSPSHRKGAHWVRFFGQETASLPGVDVLARRMAFPVVFFHVQRIRRGFYEVHFADLYPTPEGAEEAHITQSFAYALQQVIERQPAHWLWTHRRWKMQRH